MNKLVRYLAAKAGTKGGIALSFLLFHMPFAHPAPARTFDVTSLRQGEMWQSRMLARTNPDPGCAAQYGLSELEGEGEHTVYQSVDMPGEVTVHVRIRAALRYGVQIGFASDNWSSYSLANVSLISGTYTVLEGGSMKSVRSTVVPRPDSWIEISFTVANQSPTQDGNRKGFGFVKLTADGGAKDYRGRPGYGVELCAISP